MDAVFLMGIFFLIFSLIFPPGPNTNYINYAVIQGDTFTDKVYIARDLASRA